MGIDVPCVLALHLNDAVLMTAPVAPEMKKNEEQETHASTSSTINSTILSNNIHRWSHAESATAVCAFCGVEVKVWKCTFAFCTYANEDKSSYNKTTTADNSRDSYLFTARRESKKKRIIAELWLLLLAVSVSACLPGIVLHLQRERKRKNEMSIVMMSTVAVVVVDE